MFYFILIKWYNSFDAVFVISLSATKKIQFFVIYVSYGFTLNAITSIMLAFSIYQSVVILGIVLIVTLKYMLSSKQNFMSFIKENLSDSLKLDNMNSTSTLVLKQPVNLSQLFNQFNNITKNHTEILIMLWNADIMI